MIDLNKLSPAALKAAMTRDIPILCRGTDVRAILDGRKTQMRCELKPQPQPQQDIVIWLCQNPRPFRPGQRLWVREAWAARSDQDHLSPTELNDQDVVPLWYKADPPETDLPPPGRWRSPLHMPRWASRITLLVTDVRVERVQDISEAPRDGTHLLCFHPKYDMILNGVWDGGHIDDFEMKDERLEYIKDFRPTHFRPLPAPPQNPS